MECVALWRSIAMSRMLFVALALICWPSLPATAAVLTLSCDGTMKAEEEQEKPHAITKMGLIVGQLEKFLSASRHESDSVTARGHGRMERAGHGAEGLFRC